MSNQIVISSGAKVRALEGVLTGTAGIVNALSINVPNGIPQLDSNGKILVNQLPNSVMEYKGTWNVSTNTPTLVNGVGNQGDVYLVEGAAVGGTAFNFGAGPIIFFNGDQVVYSGSIWQRASGSTGTVTSVAVTESGDALSITGSPITTSGTINIGFAGNSGQYVNGAGGLTTFPTDNITGSGASGQVTYFNGTNTITGENSFNYDASTNRLGVNTTVPNATIGANAGVDSGYSLLLKSDNANYNSIGFGTDSTYGNLIQADRLGSAPSRNLTLYNYGGFMSLTEAGNLGIGLLVPNNGIDIYHATQSQLWLHNAATGVSSTDGVRLALFNSKAANLRNFDGPMSIASEGDFTVLTLGAENIRVNSADGKVGIGNPASVPEMLTVNGSIQQTGVLSALLKTNGSGKIIAAVAGTDYLAPSDLSGYVPYTGATANVNLGTHTLSAYNLIVNHTSGSGVAASITKGGSGEALTVVKSSGSGNAASITGGVTLLSELNLTTALADAYIASAATWNAKMSGSGTSGQVAYFNGSNSITSEGGFIYDSSTNRLGVNTSVPNATIGANEGLDSGYSLLLKNSNTNYNGLGFRIDSTYGHMIETTRTGAAIARNLTLINNGGFFSVSEAGNFGFNILAVNSGVDIYASTNAQLWLHNGANTGSTQGARLAYFSNKSLNLRNFEGPLSLSSESDFFVITLGAENIRVNSANGYVGIGNPATLTTILTVNGAITQSSVTSALLKTNASGTLVAAVAGTDYLAGSVISGTTDYIPRFTSSTTIGNSDISQDATFVTLNTKALSAPRARFNTAYDNASLSVNIFGQTYMDSRTSRLYQTFNLNGITNYMHIYDPFTSANANGGFSIGASSSITLLPSSSIMHIDGVNSRVGIGTTAPTKTFSVTGSSYFNGTFTLAAGAGFMYDSLRFAYSNGSSVNYIYSGGSDGLYIANQADTEILMRVTNTGNVGIGTINPDVTGFGWNTLTIRGGTAAGEAGVLELQTVTTNTNGQNIGIMAFMDGSSRNAQISVQRDSSTSTANMMFYTNAGGGIVERMKITSGGNVGIGTTAWSSAYKLMVANDGSNGYIGITNQTGTTGNRVLRMGFGSGQTYASIQGTRVDTADDVNIAMQVGGGSVNIGMTSNDYAKLAVKSNSTNNYAGFNVYSPNNNNFTALNHDGSVGWVTTEFSSGGTGFTPLAFATGGTERMRITSGGVVQIGGTASTIWVSSAASISQIDINTNFPFVIAKNDNLCAILNRTNSTGGVLEFKYNGTAVGSVSVTGSLTSYNVTSDYRLKEDFQEVKGLDKLCKIKVYDYLWKSDKTRMDGVIAHELQEVLPYAVTGEKDELDKDGKAKMQSVDYSKLVPVLVKAIQEQQSQIEELKELIKNK